MATFCTCGTPGKCYEEYDDVEDPPPEPITGGAGTTTTDDAVGTMLLDALGVVTQLHVLLSELTPDEFRAVAARLDHYKQYVAQLPAAATKGAKTIGFKARSTRRRK